MQFIIATEALAGLGPTTVAQPTSPATPPKTAPKSTAPAESHRKNREDCRLGVSRSILGRLAAQPRVNTRDECYPGVTIHSLRKPSAGSVKRMDTFLKEALAEARLGLKEGGIPIGSVLVIDNRIVGRGHNRRIQRGSAILHAEMDALENAGRLKARDYQRATLYSTLSPCDMCSGTALLYKIPRIVIGENQTFTGPEAYVRSRGVQIEIVQDPECIALMREFIRTRPELWNEDIGV